MAALRERQRAARKTKVQPSQADRSRAKPRKQPEVKYTTMAYGHAIASACKKTGIARWHPHQLRHTAGTLIRKQYGAETARMSLGHANLSATEIYAERNLELAFRVARE